MFMSNNNLVSLLFSIFYKNLQNERGLRILFNLFIKINERILISFDNLVTPNLVSKNLTEVMYNTNTNTNNEDEEKKINEETFKSVLETIFNSLIENEFVFFWYLNENKNLFFEATYQQNQPILGLNKLLQIEYFRTIIDILVNSYSNHYYFS